MGINSLEKLLVDGKEIEIVVKRGSIIDEKYTEEAKKIASFMIDKLGLSFGNVEFRILDSEQFAEKLTLYGNPLPTWDAGQEKILMENSMKYRQSTFYEVVGHKFENPANKSEFTAVYINQNDTYDEILSVIAHVYGHLHVEHNNKLANSVKGNSNQHEYYRNRYREIERHVGIKNAERVYDTAQTLAGLIDVFPDFHENNKGDYYSLEKIVPDEDVYDIFKFTLQNVKMNGWEREIMQYVYDINQLNKHARIKILHEGFATFVEDKYADEVAKSDITTAWKMKRGILSVADVLHPSQLPYYLGFRLFTDIERRWNEGKHGPLYDLLSEEEKMNYMKRENRGLSEVLEAVKSYTDWELIFYYANKDFFKSLVEEIHKKNEMLIEQKYGDVYPEEVIKKIEEKYNPQIDPNILRFQLLMKTENYDPMLYVPKGSFKGDKLYMRQDLSFVKRYTGMIPEEEKAEFKKKMAKIFSLDNEYTKSALQRIAKLWGITVIVDTMDKEGKPLALSSDGKKLYRSEKGDGPKF